MTASIPRFAYGTLQMREVQLANYERPLEGAPDALDAFYGSEEWLELHDAAVMAMIDSYNTCVIEGAAIEPAR